MTVRRRRASDQPGCHGYGPCDLRRIVVLFPRTLRHLAAGALAVALLSSGVAAQARVALDSLDLGLAGSGSYFSRNEYLAVTFTTGPSAVQIDEMVLSLADATTNPLVFNLDLYRFDGNEPVGPVLAFADLSVSGVTGSYKHFTFNKTALGALGTYKLQPNKAYALVLSTEVGTGALEDNMTAGNAYKFYEGFSAAGAGFYLRNLKGENRWNSWVTTPLLRISISPAALAGP